MSAFGRKADITNSGPHVRGLPVTNIVTTVKSEISYKVKFKIVTTGKEIIRSFGGPFALQSMSRSHGSAGLT
jgi:hypothetical protein